MAQSIRNIVHEINTSLENTLKGIKTYGVASLISREDKTLPVVDEKAVSYDDSYALQVYHKINEVNITYKPGFGNSDNTTDTFIMSMIGFNNEKITKLKNDELAMIIQYVFSLQNISSVKIQPDKIILNSQAIFGTEYRGSQYLLDEYHSLFQINYSVKVTFKSGCFDLCPEDFSQCKTN